MSEDSLTPKPTLEILTTVPSDAEAQIIIGELAASDIEAVERPGALPGGLWGTPGSRDIYVEQHELERAREIIDGDRISEDELVRAEEEDALARRRDPSSE